MVGFGCGIRTWFMKWAKLRRTEIQIQVNKFNAKKQVQESGLNLVVSKYGLVLYLCETSFKRGTEYEHGDDFTVNAENEVESG